MPRTIYIVGAGLFGSIAARLAVDAGHDVTVIDGAHPYAASKASGCVLAPSWLSAVDSKDYADGLDILKSLFRVHDMEFRTNLLATFKAKRVATSEILVKPDIVADVKRVYTGGLELDDGTKYKGIVLVAAGCGTNALLPQAPLVRPLWGASLSVMAQLEEPRLHVYAPYKQAVAFNMDKRRVWMGDGTSLVEKTWTKLSAQYIEATKARAEELFGLSGGIKVTMGARPFIKDYKAGYFDRVLPGVWVSTGGAKNGTMLAALHARDFVKAVGR